MNVSADESLLYTRRGREYQHKKVSGYMDELYRGTATIQGTQRCELV